MSRRDDDLDREIRQHLELEAEERAADGLSAEEARFAATRAFGNVATTREDARAVWFPMWLQQIGQDVRYAVRTSMRTPGFTLGAVLVFALGLGASTTLFGALNAVVLAPMPFPSPEQLVRIDQVNVARSVDRFSVSRPLLRDWQERAQSFTGIAAERSGAVTVTGLGDPVRMDAVFITHNLLTTLGITPEVGRAFDESDDIQSAGPVVVLSHSFWQRAFGGDPLVLNRPIVIDGRAHTIVGVAPPNVLRTADHVLLPLVPYTESRRGQSELDVYARLKPGLPVSQASTEMAAIAQQLEREYPEFHQGWSVKISPLAGAVLGTDAPRLLYLLLAAVGVLLLIGCANLSTLLLVRASARTREIATRAALGGGRGRIVRQLLTESLVLAVAGGAFGIALSFIGMRLVRTSLLTDLPRAAGIAVDARVLLFALCAATVTGVLSGIAPARQMSRLDVIRGLRDGSRAATGGAHGARRALVIAQLAMSVVLLTAAGLTIRAFDRLTNTDLGFAPDRIVTMRVAPRERPEAFVTALLERVRALPGVATAGAVSSAPMSSGNFSLNVFPVGEARIPTTESIQADWRIVSDGYFSAMETPVLAGRDFTTRDDEDAPKVIVMNQTLARLLWGEQDPVGRQVDLGGGGGDPATVVGVVGDMRHHNPATPPTPSYYVPAAGGVWGPMTFAVRTSPDVDDASTLVPRIRAVVAGLDGSLPLFDVVTLDSLVARQVAPQRLAATVLTAFGALALVLAVLGIYGVMAFTTRQRMREAAIRLALGGSRWGVMQPFLREGSLLVGAGVVAGISAAWLLTRFMGSQLADVDPADPMTLMGAAATLGLAAMLACYLPASRASKVNPIEALRGE
jgi:predicted permease